MTCRHEICSPQHLLHAFPFLASLTQDRGRFRAWSCSQIPVSSSRSVSSWFFTCWNYSTNMPAHLFEGSCKHVRFPPTAKFISSISHPSSYDMTSPSMIRFGLYSAVSQEGTFPRDKNCEEQFEVHFAGYITEHIFWALCEALVTLIWRRCQPTS